MTRSPVPTHFARRLLAGAGFAAPALVRPAYDELTRG